MNRASDGYTVKLGDPDAGALDWELLLSGLSDGEWTAVEDLFHTVEGRLGTFTFLDPFDNLLQWSESLSETIWQKGPLVQLTEQKPDPLGTGRATGIYNGSAAPQNVQQIVNAPASFQFAWSLFARADAPVALTLAASAGAASHSQTFGISSVWSRCVLSARLPSSDELVTFGLELPVSGAVDVFGLLVEAQPGASAYKRTGARSGVYGNARFAEDSLRVTTSGIDDHSISVRITAALKG